ncbi:MAG TPA: dienelactone hydrolase family protein [Steroidobacteraceae bacterium]|nr:dienelactone hydrolase family protein [Steroidobacteraceae bacterium]
MSNAQWETLMARDGHEFAAYLANPTGRPRGAVVVLQEIFGVNAHIRSVTERFAAAGFLAIAPALYDRVGRSIELLYSPEERTQAMGYAKQVPAAKALLDVSAAVNVVKHAGKVALAGFCWGGQLAWLGARALPVAAAVAYYPSRIGEHLDGVPACPMLLHFGSEDPSIPLADVARTRALYRQGEFHLYPAGHAFNCDLRDSYRPESAALAWQRTLDFLHQHLG